MVSASETLLSCGICSCSPCMFFINFICLNISLKFPSLSFFIFFLTPSFYIQWFILNTLHTFAIPCNSPAFLPSEISSSLPGCIFILFNSPFDVAFIHVMALRLINDKFYMIRSLDLVSIVLFFGDISDFFCFRFNSA